MPTSTTLDGPRADSAERARRRLRRAGTAALPWLLGVAAALLWWPAGFRGTAPWSHVPLLPARGWQLLLGGLAAAVVVGLLAREAWVRFGVVTGLGALGFAVSAGTVAWTTGETAVLAGLLAAGSLLGLVVGARGSRSTNAAAGALALVVGVGPTSVPAGWLLAVALALPFWTATRERVAPTVLGVVKVLAVWLLGRVVAVALVAGWATTSRGGRLDSLAALGRVARPAWDHVVAHGAAVAGAAVAGARPWFVVAAVLVAVLVLARLVRAAVARRRARSD